MRITEILAEAWSQKYKNSINCSHPRGFSQKAHCAGKKKHNESVEMEMVCEDCGMCETHGNHMMEVKQRLDAKCWKGKHKEGTKIKGGVRVNNCVPNESVTEGSLEEIDRRGFLKGVGAAAVAGAAGGAKAQEFMTDRWSNDPISIRHSFLNLYVALSMIYKKYPDDQIIKKLTRVGFSIDTLESYKSAILKYIKQNPYEKDAVNNTIRAITRTNSSPEQGLESWMETLLKYPRQHQQKYDKFLSLINEFDESINEDLDAQFDVIEEMVESLAQEHGVDADLIWEDFESVDDLELLETAAWRRKEGKSKKGGLNAKGVASYRRENPGSKLQMAVTTKPSKLKPGSKAAKRRKSFCARMSGVKGPMKKPNGKPTRKALALRKWNC
jgi:hypothetical protein